MLSLISIAHGRLVCVKVGIEVLATLLQLAFVREQLRAAYLPNFHLPSDRRMGLSGGINLAPGAHQNTGRSSSDINRAQGFDMYVCPRGSNPVDLNGRTFNTNVAEYRCKPR
jgi:hypothetical protein